MDPRIEALKSTTFLGRRFTRRQIADIQETVAMFPNDSRNELSKTICEHLDWTTPKGDYRVAAGLRLLEHLEACGILTLPALRDTAAKSPRKPVVHVRASDPQPEIAGTLAALEPLSLEEATSSEDVALWNALVDRYHYLGCPRPFGPCIRWFVRDRHGRHLAVLLFEAAARTLPARDEWIGWSAADRDRRLHLAVSNSRYLVMPWVRADNLASKALSMALRRLPGLWEERHGCRPVLCETFVDPTRFDGACYRAANWEPVGMTAGKRSGRGAKPAKQVLVRALDPEFRAVLKGEAKPRPQRKRRTPSGSRVPDDGFAAMWSRIVDAAADIAARHDRTWMKRRRTLNSLIVMLFVFRLVLSGGRKGYATVTAELWDQCRRLGVALPQPQPVAASSIGKARARVHEDVFRDLHREILAHDTHDPDWNGHRTFAVDGSKLNLPRPLAEAGYPLPNGGAHYPQGLLSCLYRLDNRMPVDFVLTPGADERVAARTHLDALSPGDVVVLDRGYFSFAMLHAMTARGLHPVFRIQRNSVPAFDRFRDGDRDDARVRFAPGKDALRKLKAAGIPVPDGPTVLRLVRYDVAGSRYVLATTLADPGRYSVEDLADLYHGRWGIEELYKVSKHLVMVDRFHGQSERGVRQELYAHFNLIAMARLFTNHGDGLLDDAHKGDLPKMRTNFANALAMLAGSLEEMVLAQAAALADTVGRVAESILKVRSRIRPGRSYPRKSMKPVSKWNRRSKAAA